MSQQQHIATNKKKKKYVTKKVVAADGAVGGGGDAASDSTKAKPFHTSTEQLQLEMQKPASKIAAASPSSPAHNPSKNNNVNTSRRAAGSNWSARGNSTDRGSAATPSDVHPTAANTPTATKTCENGPSQDEENDEPAGGAPLSKSARLRQKRKVAQLNKYLAMDCEMVGVGFNGQEDMLGRVSIVNKKGEVLLDKFVKPREAVTDYRTSISGIRPHDIEEGEEFAAVQDMVVQLLQGKILVGHAIRNDLAVLQIKHPYVNIRDTSRYKPLCRLVANGRTPSLKRLTQAILGKEIQTGEHSSVEDARAAMSIYNRLSGDWEQYLKKHQHKHK